MANIANPVPYIKKREYGYVRNIKSKFFNNRLNAAKNLYRKELICHYGCVNAIEFSSNGELLVSGGDDRRVMLWQFNEAIFDNGMPVPMKASHQSNIFCLGITTDGQKIYSGGNDDIVIVHDLESRRPLEILQHQRAVCSLSVDPFNEQVVTTAGNDGRLLLFDTRQSSHETLVISRNRKPFHGVMFHPLQQGILVSANAKDGVALWDLRSPKHPVLRYNGAQGPCQNSMSVRFNYSGSHILALCRRQSPVLYSLQSQEPVAEFYHQDYYNSCTMKSCSFAGEGDQYVLSGSDDFNLYMWKIPDCEYEGESVIVEPPHIVLYGHRSIVNQVRYNPHYCLIASSGVEKIIKVWSGLEFPQMRGTLLEEAVGSDNPRDIYSHEDYVSLVHHSGQYTSHSTVTEQSTTEDPRMMAFFDSLVQRELECLADETDSLDESSSALSHRNNDSDSTENDQAVVDFLTKRANPNGNRSQRCPNRLARLVASRYSKNLRSQKRGMTRRSKPSRAAHTQHSQHAPLTKSAKGVTGGSGSGKGKRAAVRRARGPRRPAQRAALSRISAPSSERTDSDEPAHCFYRNSGRIIRPPLRRRINLTRSTTKRKPKVTNNYRKVMNLRSNGAIPQDSHDNGFSTFDNFEENLTQPSTSTGYRGQNTSALFRIAEVDSDDEQPASSRPLSPRQNQVPANLVSIMPTPINGSRDCLADTLGIDSSPPPPPDSRRNQRRVKRNGRLLHRSDSSESPSPKEPLNHASTSAVERLSPKLSYNRTVARLMNETNESELESSCSTEGSTWPPPNQNTLTPESGVGTLAGSSTRNVPPNEVSDDPEYQAVKLRQRVKKARRNYRNHMDSDSN